MSRHIDCDATAATRVARIYGLVLDLGVILAGIGLYLAAVKLWLGFLPAGRPWLIALGVAAGTIAVGFKALCVWGNGDTPGQHWMGLRVTAFNGRKPTRSQRAQRALAGFLVSFGGMGLGLAWAMVDEEALTFHDLISRTFPAEKE